MNFSQLIAEVESKVGTNSQTKYLLNRSQKLLIADSKRRKTLDITFTAGVADIPAECLVVGALLIDKREIDQLEDKFMENRDTVSIPAYYKVEDEQIILDTKYSGSAKLYCVPKPAEMVNDSDTVPLAGSELAAKCFALWQIYADDETSQEASFWQQRFTEEANTWLALDGKKFSKPLRAKQHRSWS